MSFEILKITAYPREITTTHGKVSVEIDDFPSCCGMAIVHNFNAQYDVHRAAKLDATIAPKVYDALAVLIKTIGTTRSVGKVVLADRVRKPNELSFHNMAKYLKFDIGKAHCNPVHDNQTKVLLMEYSIRRVKPKKHDYSDKFSFR